LNPVIHCLLGKRQPGATDEIHTVRHSIGCLFAAARLPGSFGPVARAGAEGFRPMGTLTAPERLSILPVPETTRRAGVAQLVEHLICNEAVGGSSPFASSSVSGVVPPASQRPSPWEGFPSGQREQTVNLPAKPSEVRILPPPPNFIWRNDLSGNSSVVERQPSKLRVAGSNPVSRSNLSGSARFRAARAGTTTGPAGPRPDHGRLDKIPATR